MLVPIDLRAPEVSLGIVSSVGREGTGTMESNGVIV